MSLSYAIGIAPTAAASGDHHCHPKRQPLLLRMKPARLHCLQAQCILFRRYPEVLEPFKYAGYPMLLQAVALPQQDQGGDPSAHFLGPEQAPRLQVPSTRCNSAELLHPNGTVPDPNFIIAKLASA